MTTGWLEKKCVVSDWLTVVPVGYLLSQGESNTKNKTKTIPTCFQRNDCHFCSMLHFSQFTTALRIAGQCLETTPSFPFKLQVRECKLFLHD